MKKKANIKNIIDVNLFGRKIVLDKYFNNITNKKDHLLDKKTTLVATFAIILHNNKEYNKYKKGNSY